MRHLDAVLADVPPGGTHRCVTMLYYLNPDWQPSDGGTLRAQLAHAGAHSTDSMTVDPVVRRRRQLWFATHASRFSRGGMLARRTGC